MAASVSLELDPIFLKGLSYLHSKNKDSAEKLKALLDESMARGSDSSYRSSLKDIEVSKSSVSKLSLSKQDSKSSSSSSSSSGSSSSSKSSNSEKVKKDAEKRPAEKVRVELTEVDPPKKPRLEKQENRSSPITVQTSKDLILPNIHDYDETNADDFAMEMGLACVVCRQMNVTMGNQLVECQECHNLYHQECHKPPVSDKDVNDPRLVWYCARCTRQMKRMAQKAQKPPQKPAPAAVSVAPVVKDTLVKKPELKLKSDTASTFQAFKRTEVKASTTTSAISAISNNSSTSSGSGLSGWAAFGAKTNPSISSSSKLGTSGPGSGQKPVGLSALAGNKSGLAGSSGAKIPTGGGNGNGSNQGPLKPPPPLTLGKQALNRATGGDGQSKLSATGPSGAGSPGSSSMGGNGGAGGGNNNGGGNGNNGNGAKGATGDKAPTSQESQLQAMKRLQMVKKKAAQKKMKK